MIAGWYMITDLAKEVASVIDDYIVGFDTEESVEVG